jgi:hypothetical protein
VEKDENFERHPKAGHARSNPFNHDRVKKRTNSSLPIIALAERVR